MTTWSGSKPNFLCSSLSGAEAPKSVHPDNAAGMCQRIVPIPKVEALLHRDPSFHVGRQNAVAVRLRLVVENLPRGHRHYARANAFCVQLLMGCDRQANFAARSDDDHFWVSAGSICEHIGALRDSGSRGILTAIESRQGLTRQRQHCGLVAQLHDETVCLDYFIGISWSQCDQPRYRTQGNKMLDRLVGRAVLAVAHGVMRENENRWQFHQRRQANCRPGIIAEYEERRAKGRAPSKGQVR